jgi:hypothetical protein
MHEYHSKFSSKQLSKNFRNFFYDIIRGISKFQDEVSGHFYQLLIEVAIPELINQTGYVKSRLGNVG